MNKLTAFTSALSAANMEFEVHEKKTWADLGFEEKLIGVNMGKHVWAWFSYDSYEHGKKEFISFDHAYSRNTGRAMKGTMKSISIKDRIEKKTGYNFYAKD